jgi:hypothetical protein
VLPSLLSLAFLSSIIVTDKVIAQLCPCQGLLLLRKTTPPTIIDAMEYQQNTVKTMSGFCNIGANWTRQRPGQSSVFE